MNELRNFKQTVEKLKYYNDKEDIGFEGLAYQIMFNTENTLNQLQKKPNKRFKFLLYQ